MGTQEETGTYGRHFNSRLLDVGITHCLLSKPLWLYHSLIGLFLTKMSLSIHDNFGNFRHLHHSDRLNVTVYTKSRKTPR